jgi:hypothetical protein
LEKRSEKTDFQVISLFLEVYFSGRKTERRLWVLLSGGKYYGIATAREYSA